MSGDVQGMIARLRAVMGERALNARELAERAAVGPSFVYDILHGKSTNPTTWKLLAVAGVLGVSVQYLLQGKAANENAARTMKANVTQDALIHIPVMNVCMGMKRVDPMDMGQIQDVYPFSRGFLQQITTSKLESLRMIRVQGDAMLPTVTDGDYLLVSVATFARISPGIYVLDDGGAVYVKRVRPLKKGNFRIISDNNAHPSYRRSADEVRFMARVVWLCRHLG